VLHAGARLGLRGVGFCFAPTQSPQAAKTEPERYDPELPDPALGHDEREERARGAGRDEDRDAKEHGVVEHVETRPKEALLRYH